MVKIAILGSGSIGCYLGAHLLQAEQNVYFFGRKRMQKELQECGLHISNLYGQSFAIPAAQIQYETDLTQLAEADIYLITVKSQDTESLLQDLRKCSFAWEKKVFISFQNGTRNPTTIRHIFPESICLPASVPYNVLSSGNGRFHCGTSGQLLIQQLPQISDTILQIFRRSKLAMKTHPNMQGVLWGKLIFNINNSLNAIAGIPLREELENRRFRLLLAKLMQESLAVLKRAKIQTVSLGTMIPWLAPHILSLPDFLFFRVASSMLQIDRQARSSMWEDLQRQRKTEIDYLNGEIVELGKRLSYPTPYNNMVISLIREAEEKRKGSPKLGADAIWEKFTTTP
ncbi:MAG: 2-dehydropantoate 2-reductase [Spirochaetota bacterium]